MRKPISGPSTEVPWKCSVLLAPLVSCYVSKEVFCPPLALPRLKQTNDVLLAAFVIRNRKARVFIFNHLSQLPRVPFKMSVIDTISLLVPSLFSLQLSKLLVWKVLFETSKQEYTLELAGNLQGFQQNGEYDWNCNNLCWKTNSIF